MDKPEVIHRNDTKFGPEVLLVKEIVFADGVEYAILSTLEHLADDWNPTATNLLDEGQDRGEILTTAQLDALCAWWQARRPATVLDKPALEALVKRWRETARRLYPDIGAKYSNIRRAGVYDRCATELEGLLSSAEPSSLTEAELKAIFEFRLAVSEAEDEDVGTVRIGTRHAATLRNLLERMGGTS